MMNMQQIRLEFDNNVSKYDDESFTLYTPKAGDIVMNLKDVVQCEAVTPSSGPSELRITGNNLCDVFDTLYKNAIAYKQEHFDYFKEKAYGRDGGKGIPFFRFKRTHRNAVPPRKNKPSDSGFDLVLIEKIKEYHIMIPASKYHRRWGIISTW
jgi:hypothetical protein